MMAPHHIFPTIYEINHMESLRYIYYREGYKYQLTAPYVIRTPITPEQDIIHEWFILTAQGVLYVYPGYAWDGASGPTFDSISSMRGSLIHDCFCQLMKERLISYEQWNQAVHKEFYTYCREDGMWPLRASIWYAGVNIGQGGNPVHEDEHPVLIAPKPRKQDTHIILPPNY